MYVSCKKNFTPDVLSCYLWGESAALANGVTDITMMEEIQASAEIEEIACWSLCGAVDKQARTTGIV